MELRKRLVALATIVVLALLVSSFAIPVVASAHNNAPGNNGTVKIHEGNTEAEPIVRNEPQVCTFHVHFFFADQGQSGSWWIQSWPPTGDKTTVLSGNYLTDSNGEYRTPASPDVYSLPNGHYKLFWQGRNDKNVKHKVFWVKCETPSPTPTPKPTPKPTPTPTATPTPTPTSTPTPTATPKPTPKPTLPPTDTSDITPTGSSGGLPITLGFLALLSIALLCTNWYLGKRTTARVKNRS